MTRAISRGILVVWPEAAIEHKPIADGGEGFAEALSDSTTKVQAPDALGREVTAQYGWRGRRDCGDRDERGIGAVADRA